VNGQRLKHYHPAESARHVCTLVFCPPWKSTFGKSSYRL
jgi:hypothetical protein